MLITKALPSTLTEPLELILNLTTVGLYGKFKWDPAMEKPQIRTSKCPVNCRKIYENNIVIVLYSILVPESTE